MNLFKKTLSFILTALMLMIILPAQYSLAAENPSINLGSTSLIDNKYYYSNAVVSGDNIRTILVSFSDNVTSGDKIILPAATPSGFTVSSSSLGNDYTKRINLNAGISAVSVQEYIRGIGFSIASRTQSAVVTVTTDNIVYDTFYNIDTKHYYQYIPDTSSSWIEAYEAAKNMTYMGRTGYLATIMNQNEDEYVNSLSNGKTGWLGGTILTNSGSKVDSVGGTTGSLLYYSSIATTSIVSTGWYWACGPEIGTTFYNTNSLYPNANSSNANIVDNSNTSSYFNWARGSVSYEPNNQTAYRSSTNGDYETCLTTLKISGNTGKHGTSFSWNDKHYDTAGTGEWNAKGYFVEYGNLPLGDNTDASLTFATDSGTLDGVYTATVNTKVDGIAADVTGSVELKQGGTTMATAVDSGTGLYSVAVVNGTYDIYINSEDTGINLAINGAVNSATVDYYTVSFSVTDAGTASGSTISATADGSAIASGAVVLVGKTVVITATGAGATAYTYAWSGDGTIGETTAALSIALLSSKVNAACTVTGITLVTVTFDADSGGSVSPTSQTKRYGSTYGKASDKTMDEALPTPTKTGYTFGGWWTGDNGTGSEVTNSTIVATASNHTLYAKWTANTYMIIFNKNAESAAGTMEPQSREYDDGQALTANAFSRTGYNFLGWSTDPWETVEWTDGANTNLTSEDGATVTLYAMWEARDYYVMFYKNAESAAGTMEPQGREYDDGQALTANAFSRTGYDFLGWSTDPWGMVEWTDGANTNLTSADGVTVELYAVWGAHDYTVTFDKNAESAAGTMEPQSREYDDGQALTANAFSRTGYNFLGWSTDPWETVEWTDGANTNLTSEDGATVTLYAMWEARDYTVTFDAEGGSVSPSSQDKLFDSTYGMASDGTTNEALPAPTKTGYTFGGWWTGDNGTGNKIIDATTVSIAADHTLYAKWTKNAPDTIQTSSPQSLTLNTTFKFAKGNTWECVTDNFSMLGSSVSNTHIIWTSSDANIVRIEQNSDGAATGFVTRPQYKDTSVIITATATKGEDSLSKTFLLIIKRQGVTKNEIRAITNRSATIQAGYSTKSEPIYQTLLNDGTKIDYVEVTADTLQEIIRQNGTSGNIVVTIDSISNSQADEFAFEVSPESVSAIAQNGLGITLASPAGTVMFSAETLKQASHNEMSLFFRIVNAADQSEDAKQAFLSDGTVFSLSNISGEVFGTPKTIQTNMENFATTIILPLNGLTNKQLADEAFLKTLCVYVEHEDGTTQLVSGTLVYTNDEHTHIRFSISKFSRFQIVSIERSAAGPWIWIVCIAGGILLISAIILLAVLRKRNQQARR